MLRNWSVFLFLFLTLISTRCSTSSQMLFNNSFINRTVHQNWTALKFRCPSQSKPNDGKVYCVPVRDALGMCWNYTLSGSTAKMPCPPLSGFDASKFAEKKCLPDGSWYSHPNINTSYGNYTNYLICIDTDLRYVTVVYITGYSISTLALLMSLSIFFYFKQLSCQRVTLHKNLFISYVFNAIFWMILYSFIYFDKQIGRKNTWYCQIVHLLAIYFSTASYFWMFSEGLYLLVILLLAFNKGAVLLRMCVTIGWGIPAVLTIVYGIVRKIVENPLNCWNEKTKLIFITAAPIIITLGSNLIFVIIIFGLLITKLRSSNSPDQLQSKKAAKAIIILVPLLGIQYILTLIQPTNRNLNIIHHYAVAFLVSFQGLFMSIILCFTNYEVISLLRRRFGQHHLLMPNSAAQMIGENQGATFVMEIKNHNPTRN